MDGAAARVKFNFSGRGAHAVAAANDAGEIVGALGGKQGFDFFAGNGIAA